MIRTEYGIFDGNKWESVSQLCFKNNFREEAYQEIKATPCSQLIWHQLTAESKKIFMDLNFENKIDDNGNEVANKPEGYERFLEGIVTLDSLLNGWEAFATNMTINGFFPDYSKKKI